MGVDTNKNQTLSNKEEGFFHKQYSNFRKLDRSDKAYFIMLGLAIGVLPATAGIMFLATGGAATLLPIISLMVLASFGVVTSMGLVRAYKSIRDFDPDKLENAKHKRSPNLNKQLDSTPNSELKGYKRFRKNFGNLPLNKKLLFFAAPVLVLAAITASVSVSSIALAAAGITAASAFKATTIAVLSAFTISAVLSVYDNTKYIKSRADNDEQLRNAKQGKESPKITEQKGQGYFHNFSRLSKTHKFNYVMGGLGVTALAGSLVAAVVAPLGVLVAVSLAAGSVFAVKRLGMLVQIPEQIKNTAQGKQNKDIAKLIKDPKQLNNPSISRDSKNKFVDLVHKQRQIQGVTPHQI